MKKTAYMYQFIRKNDGSTLIEFAIVVPIFFLFFFGIIEFGLVTFHKIAIERIAMEVSRIASVGTTGDSSCPADTALSPQAQQVEYIKCIVRIKASGLINSEEVQVQVQPIAGGGKTSAPDICFDDPKNPSSLPTTCALYEDVNGDGKYNGLSSNPGFRGDIIEVRISYPWKVQLPFMHEFFTVGTHTGVAMLTASTVIKNEPFR